jgi:outer membrane protein assembly factor BamB
LTADHLYAYALDTHEPLWNYAVSGARDMVLAQLDADGQQEIVFNTSPGLVIDALTHVIDWQFTSGQYAALGTAHVLADGTTQFMASGTPPSYSAFTVYGGAPLSPLWSAGNAAGGIAALAGADVDGNGREVVVEADSQWGAVNVFDPATHQQRYSIPNTGWGVNALASADLDGDHVPEIVFAATRSMGNFGIVIADGRTGQAKWTYTPHDALFSNVAIADVDGDGEQELVVADKRWSERGGVEVYDFASGALKWQSQLTTSNGFDPFEISTSRILLVPHANGIGQDIVLAGAMFYDGKITVLDGVTHGARLLTGQPGGVMHDRAVIDAVLIDFDRDGTPDYALATQPVDSGASGAKLFVFSGKDGQVLWSSPTIAPNLLSIIATGPATSPLSELIAVHSNDMVAYNVQTGALDWTLPLPLAIDGATFIPNGQHGAEIAVFQSAGQIIFYDAVTRVMLRRWALPSPLSAVLPLDAGHLLIASNSALAVLDAFDPAIPACTGYLGFSLGDGNRLAAVNTGPGQWLVASGNQMVFRHLLSMDTIFAATFSNGSRSPACITTY